VLLCYANARLAHANNKTQHKRKPQEQQIQYTDSVNMASTARVPLLCTYCVMMKVANHQESETYYAYAVLSVLVVQYCTHTAYQLLLLLLLLYYLSSLRAYMCTTQLAQSARSQQVQRQPLTRSYNKPTSYKPTIRERYLHGR
jgi:hypothetical protein